MWGAGIRLCPVEYSGQISRRPEDIYSSAKLLLEEIPYSGSSTTLNIPSAFKIEDHKRPPGSDRFDFLYSRSKNNDVRIFPSALAIDVEGDSKCRGCGDCLVGCPCNSIFDSGVAFDFAVAKMSY